MASMTQEVSEGNGAGSALALTRGQDAGTLAMALLSDDAFEVRLEALRKGQDRISRVKRELMQVGAHYGVIPGTKKPTLLKPGAEVLCSIYGLRPDFVPTVQYGDGATSPTITVLMRCELHLGDTSGPVVAVGYGAANSWERKHRYRASERSCPACGLVGTIRRSSFEKDGDKGWYCHRKVGGCGANFHSTDPAITEQHAGQVDNPDPYDLLNTLVKMSKKRAHIDAALTGTASSDLFTQDLDELAGKGEPSGREPGSDDGDEQRHEHSASRPARTSASAPAPTSREPRADVPVVGSKPACPEHGERSVICRANGEWVCATAKGGCGNVLGRVR